MTKEEFIQIIDEMSVDELKELIKAAEKRLLSQKGKKASDED